MPAQAFSIEVQGLEAVEKKMGHALEPTKTMVHDLGLYVQAEAAKFAKPHPADTGSLAQSVKIDIFGGAGRPLWAKVYTRSGIAWKVEEGQSGEAQGASWRLWPKVAAIERWALAHGYIQAGATPALTRKRAYALVQHISKVGIKGVFFMEKAEKAGRKRAIEMMGKLAAEIERHWGA